MNTFSQLKQILPKDKHGYRVYAATSVTDLRFIEDLLRKHPAGLSRGDHKFIADYEGARVGAVIVATQDGRKRHGLAVRRFGSHYGQLNRNALIIRRLLALRSAGSRWCTHRALLRHVAEVAPELVDSELTLLEGVSYEYHPVALQVGFHVETPLRPGGSFYYWRPYGVKCGLRLPKLDGSAAFRQRAKASRILKERRSMRNWLVVGKEEFITEGVRKKAWALRDSNSNRGLWRSLQEGDRIYIVGREAERLSAYGVVSRIDRRRVQRYESFPLWVDFGTVEARNPGMIASDYIQQEWCSSRAGGLKAVPEEVAQDFKQFFDSQTNGKRAMIVHPNPYLLKQTRFDTVPNRVFLVQSWKLLDTVFPVIKEILESSGFEVRYAGDRDGQVIFDDIWLMLNEASAVLVDFTDRRPNVYLEYGMALVLGKPIVAITQERDHIPSDTPNLKYVLYSTELSGARDLRQKLPRALTTTMADIQRMNS